MLRVLSPTDQTVVSLIPGLPAESQQIPFAAEARERVDWFVDGRLFGRTRAGEELWWTPTAGRHVVHATAGTGRGATVRVTVRPGG